MTTALATMDEIQREPLAKYLRVGLIVFLTLTASITFWLLVRRVSGALLTLSVFQTSIGGFAALSMDVGWRAIRRRVAGEPPSLVERWLPTLVLVASLITLASATGPWGSWVTVALLAVCSEAVWHRFVEPIGWSEPPADAGNQDGGSNSAAEIRGPQLNNALLDDKDFPGLSEDEECSEEDFSDGEMPSDDIQQKWVRSLAEDGTEQIWGIVRVHFVPDQRVAIVHAAFCPVLEQRPAVDAYAVQGPDATVRATSIHLHGVRLEVRLARPAEQNEVVTIEVIAAG